MQEYCENKIATSFQACGDFSVCKPPILFLQSPPRLRCTTKVFNGRVVIENNTFTQESARICAVDCCREVIFRGNRFVRDEAMPKKHPHGETGCSFDLCDHIEVEPILKI